MDKFINAVESIHSEFSKIESSQFSIVDTKLINNQVLVYYLYRIFCKYSDIFKLNVSESQVNDIFQILRISLKHKKCAPLVNKLTRNIKELESIYQLLINIFKKLNENINKLNKQGNPELMKHLTSLLNSKSNKITIKEDLIMLTQLIPDLGKTDIKPSQKLTVIIFIRG